MPGQRVEITYEAFVRGVERIEELVKKNQELQQQTEQYKEKLRQTNAVQEKQDSIFLKARRGIIAFRRELFAIAVAVGVVAGSLKLLSFGSETAAAGKEELGVAIRNVFGKGAETFARLFTGGKPKFTTATEVRLLMMQADIEEMRGNMRLALQKKFEAEEKRLIKETGLLWELTYKKVFEERRRLALESARLEELGLKSHARIRAELKSGVVGGTAGAAGDVLFQFLQGEMKSRQDILKTFQTNFNRVIADAISQSLFTAFAEGGGLKGFFNSMKDFFKGRSPQVKEQEQTNDLLNELNKKTERVAVCICTASERLGAISGAATGSAITAEIIPPPRTALDKIGAIAGAISTVASLGSAIGGAPPGIPKGGNFPTRFPPDIKMLPPSPIPDVPALPIYQRGGEIPILAHRGEFVMNAQAAQENKDLLKSINAGERTKTAQNVYFIKTNDAQSFAQMLASPAARTQIEIGVSRAILTNGQIRQIMRDFVR